VIRDSARYANYRIDDVTNAVRSPGCKLYFKIHRNAFYSWALPGPDEMEILQPAITELRESHKLDHRRGNRGGERGEGQI